MRIAGIRLTSLFDGEGINAVVFFQGCSLHCRGCHNHSTWDFNGGTETTLDEVVSQIKTYLGFIDGITLSGGNPVESWDDAYALAEWAKKHGLSVTLYSGFPMNELERRNSNEANSLLDYVDTVIDAPFMQDLKADLPFRGSSNQRIYHKTDNGWACE